LLKLPVEIQLAIRNNDITMGHARALINIENVDKQLDIYNQIILSNLSVREVEDLARGAKTEIASALNKNNTSDKNSTKGKLTFEQLKMVDDLRAVFNTKVNISKEPNGKGKIIIPFKSDNDLKRILDLLDA
jgi:ParB family chromosome partitioning protein